MAGPCSGVGHELWAGHHPHQVVGLQPEKLGHAGGDVQEEHGPAPHGGYRPQPGVRVDGVGMADRGQQGHVIEAVGISEALAQVDVAPRGPPPHRAELAQGPHELPDQLAGVLAPVLGVAGGDDVVEAQSLGQGKDKVVRGGGGEHRGPARAAVLGQEGTGEGRDQLLQLVGRGPARFPHRLRRPPPGEEGRAPSQGDGRQRLAHGLIERVEGALERELALGGDPRGHQGLIDQGPARAAKQGAIEVEEGCRAHAVHGTAAGPRCGRGPAAAPSNAGRWGWGPAAAPGTQAAGAGGPGGTAMSACAKSHEKREGAGWGIRPLLET